jgi:N6-adenosine-specific RNA methylase IME4
MMSIGMLDDGRPGDGGFAAGPFAALPERVFGVILADPPWRFQTYSARGRGRCPDGDVGAHHYETMADEAIAALPVDRLAARTCRLFLWCTVPHLEIAIGVMRAWGLPYKSNWAWVKEGNVGTGYWGRSAHELVLIGAHGPGACFPRGAAPPSAFAAPKGRHSEKPEEVHARIERAWPAVLKLELFARAPRPGWWCWGDEVGVVDPAGRRVRRSWACD